MRQLLTFAVATATLSIATAQTTVSVFNLSTGDIAFDRKSGQILATRGGSLPTGQANRLALIDPTTGSITRSVFVGSEAQQLALSSTGNTAFVGISGAGGYATVNLDSWTASQIYSIAATGTTPRFVDDMAVVPGSETAVAISMRNTGFSPRHEGVTIIENGIRRSVSTPGHTGSNVIEFGANSSRLYGYNNETTEYGFRTMTVSDTGVAVNDVTRNLAQGFGLDFEMMGLFGVFTSGRIINAEARTLIATLPTSGILETDLANKQIWFLEGTGATRTLKSFNTDDYGIDSTITVTGVSGTATSLIRWGTNGLAFRTTGNQLYVIQSSVVPEPASMIALSIGVLALIRKRRNQ